MRYKTPVLKNLDSAKNTMDMTVRLLQNNNINSAEMILTLNRVLKYIESAINLVDKEEETR